MVLKQTAHQKTYEITKQHEMSVEMWIIMNVSSEKKGVAMTLLESVKAFFIINKYINQIHESTPKSTQI